MYIQTHICIHSFLQILTPNGDGVECRITIYNITLKIFLSLLDSVGYWYVQKFCFPLCRNFYLDSEISQYSHRCLGPLHSISCWRREMNEWWGEKWNDAFWPVLWFRIYDFLQFLSVTTKNTLLNTYYVSSILLGAGHAGNTEPVPSSSTQPGGCGKWVSRQHNGWKGRSQPRGSRKGESMKPKSTFVCPLVREHSKLNYIRWVFADSKLELEKWILVS